MPGAGAQKRYHALAVRAARLARQGHTHRQIAEAIGKKPEQIKAMVMLGERLNAAAQPATAAN